MKTLPCSLFSAGLLLNLLVTAPLLATDTLPNPERKWTSSGWVSSPDASFNARTYQADNGDMVVQVTNRSLRQLTIQMQTLRGEEVAHVPVAKSKEQLAVRLDVSELTDGDYRIIISTDNERIVKLVSLTTPTPVPALRRTAAAVVKPVSDQ